jgi:Ca2+-binding EF-hand superfamily protein
LSSRHINLKEWLHYLCTTPANTGKSVFRQSLRKLFNQFDKDNSGYLNFRELRELIKEQFRVLDGRAKTKGGDKVNVFNDSVEAFTKEVMSYLNEDNDQMITWLEFKNYMEKCLISQQQMFQYLQDLI